VKGTVNGLHGRSSGMDLRWARNTLLIAVLAGILAGLVSLFLPKTYRAEAKILPDMANDNGSGLAGLAAASGLSGFLSQFGTMENPILTYPEVLSSRTLLERVALSPYSSGSGKTSNILQALGVTAKAPREAMEQGVHELGTVVSVRPNPRSGLITVDAVTRDSVLSAVIVQRMLDELGRFNFESRSSKGRAAREFIAGRLVEAKEELVSAEDALAGFRRSNIRIDNSPHLQLGLARMERLVQTRSEVYNLLIRQYEVARIEEKRDTPTFSVIDPPRPPVRKYRPKILVNAFVAMLAAIGLRIMIGLIPAFMGSGKAKNATQVLTGTDGIREFQR
jgi:uncharacterized protein involved in exopolysaccharide biosynthesis